MAETVEKAFRLAGNDGVVLFHLRVQVLTGTKTTKNVESISLINFMI